MNLAQFISQQQLSVLRGLVQGEEKEHFKELIANLKQTIASMPKTYETDGQGDNAIAYLHYFSGGFDWYITERDMDQDQLQSFGLVSMYETELGYINIKELKTNNIELDLYWTPKTIGEIKNAIQER